MRESLGQSSEGVWGMGVGIGKVRVVSSAEQACNEYMYGAGREGRAVSVGRTAL